MMVHYFTLCYCIVLVKIEIINVPSGRKRQIKTFQRLNLFYRIDFRSYRKEKLKMTMLKTRQKGWNDRRQRRRLKSTLLDPMTFNYFCSREKTTKKVIGIRRGVWATSHCYDISKLKKVLLDRSNTVFF